MNVFTLQRYALLLFLIPLCMSCSQQFSINKSVLQEPKLAKVINNPAHQVQIIYTQINRDAQNHPQFKDYTFGVDSLLYFYPASTVKMPASFLALQRLNELGIDKSTPLKIGKAREVQTAVSVDSSAINNLPSIENYIEKIFLVSDNDAFNRLYEFLGQDYINSQLQEKGLQHSFIKHRLVGGYDGEENQYINPFTFYKGDSILYERGGVKSTFNFEAVEPTFKNRVRGKGYWDGEQVINEPFNFEAKNAISLQDLHHAMQRVLFPEAFLEHEQFHLAEADYQFLYEWMSKFPRQVPRFNYNEPDSFAKSVMVGHQPDSYQLPDHIKVFSKAGWAYGFLTEVAYVIDTQKNIEYMLSVQLLVNENDIFNDGVYEYNTVGKPFIGELSEMLYHYELNRKRNYQPNLNKYIQ